MGSRRRCEWKHNLYVWRAGDGGFCRYIAVNFPDRSCKAGIVAAVLEDTTANYINLYNTDGSKIYTVKTTLAGDGYPLDISISEDATKLIASYLYVSGESIKTNVVFTTFRKSDKMKRSV